MCEGIRFLHCSNEMKLPSASVGGPAGGSRGISQGLPGALGLEEFVVEGEDDFLGEVAAVLLGILPFHDGESLHDVVNGMAGMRSRYWLYSTVLMPIERRDQATSVT